MMGSWRCEALVMGVLAMGAVEAFAQQTGTTAPAARTDAGGPIQTTKNGHVSNYDEAKVGTYTLPDPLTLSNGEKVTDAGAWREKRRPEILGFYQKDIYGAVPGDAPSLKFSVVERVADAMGKTATAEKLEGHIGGGDGPVVHVLLLVPRDAKGPVPVVLNLSFSAPPAVGASAASAPATTMREMVDNAPIGEILAHGYAYATLRYTEIQPDNAKTFSSGVIGPTLKVGMDRAANWGTISAWAYGVSRVVDYLQTDPAVDGKRIALVGHSRLGKTVLWAGAQDERIALVFSSCAGELGSALGRRDYGESIDDMVQNFPWQLTATMTKYVGHWNDMPVDTHMLISLIAPRPLLITGGSKDQWADPRGEFLAAVAAGPVYELLGKKGLGTDRQPALDVALTAGDLAFEEHMGAHTITPGDWKIFLEFADRHLLGSSGAVR